MSLGGLGSTVSSLPVAGDALGGLNPGDAVGSEGLSVAGLIGIGSNEQNAIDLMPKEKKEAYLERRKNVKSEAEKKALQRELEDSTGKKVVGRDDEELAERAKKGGGGLPGGLPDTGSVTKGVPLDAAKGVAGGGGPVDSVKGLTKGPLDTTSSLAGGAADGLPTDVAGGLLGGGKGLNVGGLVGLGSDEEAAVDLLPAEKKQAFIQRYKNAKSEEEKAELRRKLMKQADSEADNMGLDDDQREDLRDVSPEERQEFLEKYKKASPREKTRLSNRLEDQAKEGRRRKKEEPSSSRGGGGGKGLLGGKTPVDSVTGGGLGGTLDPVKGVAEGPLDTAGGAAGGLPGGLIGGSKGLNVGGLVGLGSDEEAAVDLLPTEKKKAFAERWKAAKTEEEKDKLRQALMKQANKEAEASNLDDEDREALKNMDPDSRQRHVQAMREADTPAKRNNVRESMRRTSRTQTQTRRSGGGGGGGHADSAGGGRAMCLPMCTHEASSYESRPSLFYSYLVPSSRGRSQNDSYMLTFANPSVADKWYDEASRSYDVERPGHQFFSYRGEAPKAVSPSISRQMHATRLEGMDCFPVLPLQTVDGYMVGPRYQQTYVVNRSCASCRSSSGSYSIDDEREEFRSKMSSYERERSDMEERHRKNMSRWEEKYEAAEERHSERERQWNKQQREYNRRIGRLEEELEDRRSSNNSSHRHRSEHDDDLDDDWLTDSKNTSSYGNGGRKTGNHRRNASDSTDDWLDDFDDSTSGGGGGGRGSKGRRETSDDSWLNESSETTSSHRQKSTREESHSTSSSRKHWTMESMAREHARNQVARGDRRSEDQIYREALADLRADCTNCH